MIPTRLVLSGYVRFMSSDQGYIELTFTSPLQLVLGTNGSGKSSLLSEATPYPSHHSNFVKGGYKIIEVLHNHLHYIVKSEYNGGTGRHSLFCVEEQREYNPGGTYKAQVDLVEEVFDWDRDLMELLLGVKRFTRMSTNDRRKWLTRLCPVNMSPAFKLLKTCASLQRDQKGVLNMVSKRLVETTQAANNTDVRDDIHVVLKEHHSALERLYQQRSDLPPLPTSILNRQHAIEDRIRAHISNTPIIPKEWNIRKASDLSQRLIDTRANIAHLELATKEIVTKVDVLQRECAQFSDIDPAALQELKEQELAYTKQIVTAEREHREYVTEFPSLPHDQISDTDVTAVYNDVKRLLESIPENPDGRISRQTMLEERARLNQNEALYRSKQNEESVINKRLQYIKECEDVDCPSCHHRFKPNVSPQEAEDLLRRRELLATDISSLELEIERSRVYLQEFADYHQFVVGYRELIQRHAWASGLWTYMTTNKIPFRTPQTHIPNLMFWYKRELTGVHIATLKRRLQEFQEKIGLISKLDMSALTRRKDELLQMESQHVKNLELLSSAKEHLRELVTLERDLSTYADEGHELLSQYETLKQDALLVLRHARNEALSIDIRKRQTEVAVLESQLQEINYRKGTLAALEDQKRQALEDQSLYGALVDALNPQDGLIGQYLKASMGAIVARLNAIIGRVWTYPLEVLPSPLERDDLTYKFPLQVGEQKRFTPDIELGSSSQRDIVDFAFTLIVRATLGRNDVPLFMDELGSSFDEAHRNTLSDMIDTMIENQMVQQAFFVSHDVGTHGSFTHAEICVIDPTNITKPERYNEHVRFEPA